MPQLTVQSGAGTGKAKSVSLFSSALHVEGLRNGDFTIPTCQIQLVIHTPAPVTLSGQKLSFLALILSAPLGKSSVVLVSLKPAEKAAVQPGPAFNEQARPLLAGPTDALLAGILPALAGCRLYTATDSVPCHLKVSEGVLHLLQCGLLFLPKVWLSSCYRCTLTEVGEKWNALRETNKPLF